MLVNNSPPERYELYSADRADPPQILPRGSNAAFSPDGRSLAIGIVNQGLQIWDVATLRKERELTSSDHTKREYSRVVWSPGGESIAALAGEFDKTGNMVEYIERWELSSGQVRRIFPPFQDNDYLELRYSPDGRRLFFISRSPAWGPRVVRSTTQVFDSQTLEPVPIGMRDIADIAGGLRGDTFITAGQYSVDLRDTATLQPLRRLYEGPSPPNLWPAVCGFGLWSIAFTVRTVRKRRSRRLFGIRRQSVVP